MLRLDGERRDEDGEGKRNEEAGCSEPHGALLCHVRERRRNLPTRASSGTLVTQIRVFDSRELIEPVSQVFDLVAEGEGFEPPRASQPGGFQVHCLTS